MQSSQLTLFRATAKSGNWQKALACLVKDAKQEIDAKVINEVIEQSNRHPILKAVLSAFSTQHRSTPQQISALLTYLSIRKDFENLIEKMSPKLSLIARETTPSADHKRSARDTTEVFVEIKEDAKSSASDVVIDIKPQNKPHPFLANLELLVARGDPTLPIRKNLVLQLIAQDSQLSLSRVNDEYSPFEITFCYWAVRAWQQFPNELPEFKSFLSQIDPLTYRQLEKWERTEILNHPTVSALLEDREFNKRVVSYKFPKQPSDLQTRSDELVHDTYVAAGENSTDIVKKKTENMSPDLFYRMVALAYRRKNFIALCTLVEACPDCKFSVLLKSLEKDNLEFSFFWVLLTNIDLLQVAVAWSHDKKSLEQLQKIWTIEGMLYSLALNDSAVAITPEKKETLYQQLEPTVYQVPEQLSSILPRPLWTLAFQYLDDDTLATLYSSQNDIFRKIADTLRTQNQTDIEFANILSKLRRMTAINQQITVEFNRTSCLKGRFHFFKQPDNKLYSLGWLASAAVTTIGSYFTAILEPQHQALKAQLQAIPVDSIHSCYNVYDRGCPPICQPFCDEFSSINGREGTAIILGILLPIIALGGASYKIGKGLSNTTSTRLDHLPLNKIFSDEFFLTRLLALCLELNLTVTRDSTFGDFKNKWAQMISSLEARQADLQKTLHPQIAQKLLEKASTETKDSKDVKKANNDPLKEPLLAGHDNEQPEPDNNRERRMSLGGTR